MSKYFSLEAIAKTARQAAAEGCVLLENRNQTLPLHQGDRVALFGRIAFDYYKSGLGSGGLVNTSYVVGIWDALQAEPSITLDPQLLAVYDAWRQENPYDAGQGWGNVPWSQKEMPVTQDLVAAAAQRNDVALVVIGRTAGEDQDIRKEPGSYLLTQTEKDLIAQVCRHFPRTAVLLNVGSIVDMAWVQEYQVPAVLYVWQGGQEGGNGVCDVLTGRISPSGRLTDTIAQSIDDYPSTAYFGDPVRNAYWEDIYVGYRYFETLAKDRVLYPFGYGLSYTSFACQGSCTVQEDKLTVAVHVTNTGNQAGKNAVLVFLEAPQGALGKASRVLIAFGKTQCLEPGQTQELTMEIPKYAFASFDDSGATGHRNAYVLEEGTYRVYAGGDVRSAGEIGSFHQTFQVLAQLEEAYAPVTPFDRLRPVADQEGLVPGTEPVPTRTQDPQARRLARLPEPIAYTGDRGWKLADVYYGKATMDAFVAQLTDADLMHIFRGEGMCSPKVTPGTAAAFGGLTQSLQDFGIPAGCCADGPSGIRMDCGTKAFSLPNGTLLGCTFDEKLVQSLYGHLGLELRKNRIDTLLGPGMNIHRSPLNGRNFEYISEDPLLTGKIAAAQLRGLNASGATGTVKHFCGNNQEFRRHEAEGLISQRALREIYLKGFEYAVKEGNCRSVMTTYGPVNGVWTAGSYDLNTAILRKEWGFDGIVMTDWWAKSNWEGGEGRQTLRAPMIAAQNDLYMVTKAADDDGQDDLLAACQQGKIFRSELQRSAKNVLSFLLRSVAMEYTLGTISQEELEANRAQADDFSPEDLPYYTADPETGEIEIDVSDWKVSRGDSQVCGIAVSTWGKYVMEMDLSSHLGELAQLSLSVYYDNILRQTVTIQGSGGQVVTETVDMGMVFGDNHYLKFYCGSDGLQIRGIRLKLVEAVDMSKL